MNGINGFTLIELLVVALIIGILAAVAVPQYQKAVWKSRFTQAKTMVHSLLKAEEAYYLANGAYTTQVDELSIDVGTECSINDSGNGQCTFSWGECEINPTNDTRCYVYKNGSPYIGYSHWYDHSGWPGTRGCRSFVVDNLNDISHQICKSETRRTSPTGTYSTFITYEYPN